MIMVVHTERDIVLQVLSVCLSVCLSVHPSNAGTFRLINIAEGRSKFTATPAKGAAAAGL